MSGPFTIPTGGASFDKGTPLFSFSDVGFHEFFERSPLAMWIFDFESLRFLASNAAATRQYGWSREELMQMTVEKLILERQNKPHDHLDPEKLEKFRPAWKNPLFIFGLGSIALAGMQFALNSGKPRKRTDSHST